MKKILVPTDFSENSEKAIDYAIYQAQKAKASLCFIYVAHIPMISPDMPIDHLNTIIQEEQRSGEKNLNDLVTLRLSLAGFTSQDLKYELLVKVGFAVDEIIEFSKSQKCDLIIMGTHGAGGLKKVLWGSNAINVIRKSGIPVIAVPFNYQPKTIDTVILATDYKGFMEKDVLSPLLDFTLLNNSKLLIYHARKNEEVIPTFEEAVEGLDLENKIKSLTHSYHIEVTDNIIEGINEFTEKSEADLLVLVPKQKNLFEKLFSTSVTDEVISAPKIPVMVIPDRHFD